MKSCMEIMLTRRSVKSYKTDMPAREDIDFPFEEHFIVEWYSKKA